jgi:hypothetical protein
MIQIFRDGYLETEKTIGSIKDGAMAIGNNATERNFNSSLIVMSMVS